MLLPSLAALVRVLRIARISWDEGGGSGSGKVKVKGEGEPGRVEGGRFSSGSGAGGESRRVVRTGQILLRLTPTLRISLTADLIACIWRDYIRNNKERYMCVRTVARLPWSSLARRFRRPTMIDLTQNSLTQLAISSSSSRP